MKNDKAAVFNSLLETFENEDIREFAKKCIETIPDYFWKVGASSTGKYHPKYTLGELGLARHTCALVKILNYILSVDCYRNDFTSRERDIMRVAGIMHDTRKSGDDEEYKESKYTRFDHPLLAADVVRTITGIIPMDEVEAIASIIERNMGQWCCSNWSQVVLPIPENKCQKLVHLADFLASRKEVEIVFTEENEG